MHRPLVCSFRSDRGSWCLKLKWRLPTIGIERNGSRLWGRSCSMLLLEVAEIYLYDRENRCCIPKPLSHHENAGFIPGQSTPLMRPIIWQIPAGIHWLNWPVERSKSFCSSLTAYQTCWEVKVRPCIRSSPPKFIRKNSWKIPTSNSRLHSVRRPPPY